MKKFLLFASALAGLFLAASCQEEMHVPVGDGTVTFTVTAPGQLETKAIADGENVDVVLYEIYKSGSGHENSVNGGTPLAEGNVEMKNKKATITFDLLQDQTYTVIFWAEVDGKNHYNTEDLRKIKINDPSKLTANLEERAAFYQVHEFSTPVTKTQEVTLIRPFSQLNLGTSLASLSPEQTGQTVGYTIDVEQSYLHVIGLSDTFNTLTGEAEEGAAIKDYTFALNATPYKQDNTEKLVVNGTEYHYVGMNYFFVPTNDKLVTLDYKIVTDKGEMTHEIKNVPVKANYRTNIIGNLLTNEAQFEIVVDEEFEIPDEYVGEGVVIVKNDAELLAALERNEEHLVIELLGLQTKAVSPVEYKIPVGANEPDYYFGGDKTRAITINANGNKINFVHKNGDWNYIRMVNEDAKWIINDATLTNSGMNDGPWNRHDIRFYNAVELNNVTSDKAIALLNDGKLTNVAISDVHPNNSEAYGLWISAEGQTVDLDGVSIIAHETKSTDRGIAIKDQYVDTPAKVTLNIKNSTFKTQKKAAVLVTSTAGAVINWGRGNNITGVAADPANAVWVDGGKDYQNIEDVTVTGASVIIEGQVSSTPVVTNSEELKAAIAAAGKDNQTVILLKAGTYTGAFDIDGKNVALIGEDDVVIDGLVFGLGASHILLRNITLTNEHPVASESARHKADYYCLGAYAAAFVIEDCVFNVSNQGNAAGKGAINIGDGFNAYSASDEYELIVRNTVFNCNGERAIRAKTSSWIEGCTFVDQHRYAIQVQGNEQAATEKVIFKNNTIINPCTTSGEAFAAGVSISKSQNLSDVAFTISGNTLESAAFEDLKFVYDISDNVKITTCTLNGKPIVACQCWPIDAETKEVQSEVTYYYDEATSTYTIDSLKGLLWFADQVNNKANTFAGKTVKLAADIDLAGIDWIPVGQTGGYTTKAAFRGVFDGADHTISNLTVTHHEVGSNLGKNYASGFFGFTDSSITVKNLTFE